MAARRNPYHTKALELSPNVTEAVRIREPRDNPGIPLIVTPFTMETMAAWATVEVGDVVNQALVELAPTALALRLELAGRRSTAS